MSLCAVCCVLLSSNVFFTLLIDDCSLEIGKSITIRRVVPMLGIPDALVPLELSGGKVALHPG